MSVRVVWLRRLSPPGAVHGFLDTDEARDVTPFCGLVWRGFGEWSDPTRAKVRCVLCERRMARVLVAARMAGKEPA